MFPAMLIHNIMHNSNNNSTKSDAPRLKTSIFSFESWIMKKRAIVFCPPTNEWNAQVWLADSASYETHEYNWMALHVSNRVKIQIPSLNLVSVDAKQETIWTFRTHACYEIIIWYCIIIYMEQLYACIFIVTSLLLLAVYLISIIQRWHPGTLGHWHTGSWWNQLINVNHETHTFNASSSRTCQYDI